MPAITKNRGQNLIRLSQEGRIFEFRASKEVEVTACDRYLTLELRNPSPVFNPKTNLAVWRGEQSFGTFYGAVIFSKNSYAHHIHPDYNFARTYCLETIKTRRVNDRIRFEWSYETHSMSEIPYTLLNSIRITRASVNKNGGVLVRDTHLSSCEELTVLLDKDDFYSAVSEGRFFAGAARLLRDRTQLADEVFVHRHPIVLIGADSLIEFGRSYPLSFIQLNAIEPTCKALLRQFEMLVPEG